MSRVFRKLRIPVIVVVTGLAGWLAFPPLLLAAATLETSAAHVQMLADEQRFDGVVEAVFRSTISAQTSGEIIELPYDVNDYVPKGAIIVRFEDTRQKAGLDKAVASEAQVRAQLVEAESAHQRNRRLIKDNAVSTSQLEKSEANLKSARAQLELARAELKQAREQWEFTVVRAPFAGVVVERFVEIGEHAKVGAPLGTGLSLEKLRVQVAVPAHYVQRIRDSAQARVRIPDNGQWLESADITIFPYADPVSHTFTLRVQLPDGQHGMYPGMLVKTAFVVGRVRTLLIPSVAVVHRSEVMGVYVVAEDGRVHFRQLRIGREAPGDMRVVLAGLQEGEQVALDPVAAGIALKQQDMQPPS